MEQNPEVGFRHGVARSLSALCRHFLIRVAGVIVVAATTTACVGMGGLTDNAQPDDAPQETEVDAGTIEDDAWDTEAAVDQFDLLELVVEHPTTYLQGRYLAEQDVVVALTREPAVYHLDPDTLEPLASFPLPTNYFLFTESGFGADLPGDYLSPDGRFAMFTTAAENGFDSGPCAVVNTLDGSTLALLDSVWGCNATFSADSARLYHADYPEPRIRVYDTTTFERIGELATAEPPVHLISFDGVVGFSYGGAVSEGEFRGGDIIFLSESDGSVVGELFFTDPPIGMTPVDWASAFVIRTMNAPNLVAFDYGSFEEVNRWSIPGGALGPSVSVGVTDDLMVSVTRDGVVVAHLESTLEPLGEVGTGQSSVTGIATTPDGTAIYLFGGSTTKWTWGSG